MEPCFDDLQDIMPNQQLEGWTRLPYLFNTPPACVAYLEDHGLDFATLRGTPMTDQSQWVVDTSRHVLFCKGDGKHEWLRYDRPLRDFCVHVDWRFLSLPPGWPRTQFNSGVFVRNDTAANRFYQVEVGATKQRAGFIFTKRYVGDEKVTYYGKMPLGDRLVDFHMDRPDIPDLIQPPEAWNTYDLQVQGREIKLWTNGVYNSLWEDCKVEEGYFGLEAEWFPIEFRNIGLKVL